MNNVKTKNLTPWCSLFSAALKFNIEVKPLCSQHALALLMLWLTISLVIFISAHQLLAAFVSSLSLYFIGRYSLNINEQGRELFSGLFFDVTPQGLCCFYPSFNSFVRSGVNSDSHSVNHSEQPLAISSSIESEKKEMVYWQVQPNSRYNFLGCWLYIAQSSNQEGVGNSQLAGFSFSRIESGSSKYYFIPKYCLSEQSFSRLARIIKRLKTQELSEPA